MARSINDIKKSMTDAFMADSTIREKYGLVSGDTFSEKFSVVSLESILFYIVAACCYVLETLFDTHKKEVEEKISQAVVASVPWYHKMAMSFQYGDSLVFDETTQQFLYPKEDVTKQRVKYVAVQDNGAYIRLLVAGEQKGLPAPLSNDVLTAFKSYMDRVKIAGVVLTVYSYPADTVEIHAKVQIDPLVIDANGVRISDGSYPVADAVDAYLKGILYGGQFNKTKLVDAIQKVEGVTDIELECVKYRVRGEGEALVMSGNNYNSVGGYFVSDNLKETIDYVLSL